MTNLSTKQHILEENFKSSEGFPDVKSFVIVEAENDPNFFRWLFDAELEQDFDTSLTDDQRSQYAEFLESL